MLTASGSFLTTSTQPGRAEAQSAELPAPPTLTSGPPLELTLIVIFLLLIIALQLRKWKAVSGVRFNRLVISNFLSFRKRNNEVERKTREGEVENSLAQAAVPHLRSESEDADTSKPRRQIQFDFDDEATYLLAPKVDRAIIGRLVRVTSEPRLPAELKLYSSGSALARESQITIGRHSKRNTVVICDKSVSREHAEIVQRDRRIFVRDKASSAGTLLNWKRLQANDEQPLRHNDILIFGDAVYEFHTQLEDAGKL